MWCININTSSSAKAKAWEGEDNDIPTYRELEKLLTYDISDENISYIASQVALHCPIKSMNTLLVCLFCCYWRYGDNSSSSDALSFDQVIAEWNKFLNDDEKKASQSGMKSICGTVFKKNDLVWTCRSCAKNNTCVQCDKCYNSSNHIGHEVFFHRASGNGCGCCDCGDVEAWANEGACQSHCCSIDDDSKDIGSDYSTNDDTLLACIPPLLLRGMNATLRGACSAISLYMIAVVRGYDDYQYNYYMHSINALRDGERDIKEDENKTDRLAFRLHNDDYHTYEDVIAALKKVSSIVPDMTNAKCKQIAEDVNNNGVYALYTSELISYTTPCPLTIEVLQNITQLSRILGGSGAGLLVSVLPTSVINMEHNVSSIFSFFKSIGGLNASVRRCITLALTTNVTELPQSITLSSSSRLCDLSIDSMFDHITNVHERRNQVNYYYPDTVKLFPHMLKSSSIGTPSSSHIGYNITHPFDYTYRCTLSLVILSIPFQAKKIQKLLNDIIINYQYDTVYKHMYSHMLSILYNTLFLLYSRGVGTDDNTIFTTTVQVYTSASIIHSLSYAGIRQRILHEQILPGLQVMYDNKGYYDSTLTYVLADTIETCLLDMNIPAIKQQSLVESTTAVTASIITQQMRNRLKRLYHVIKDFEYSIEDEATAGGIMREVESSSDCPSVLAKVLSILSLLQFISKERRRVQSHVEVEDVFRWQFIVDMMINMDTLPSSLLSNGIPCFLSNSSENQELCKQGIRNMVAKCYTSICSWYDVEQCHHSDSDIGSTTIADASSKTILVTRLQADNILFPSTKAYHVSSSWVSIYIPLHRFLTQIFIAAKHACSDVINECIAYLKYCHTNVTTAAVPTATTTQILCGDIFAYIDYPLRCLSFSSQVDVGLWRRNGSIAHNLNFCYSYGFKSMFYDVDVTAVQVGLLLLYNQQEEEHNGNSYSSNNSSSYCSSNSSILALMIDRFELTNVIELSPSALTVIKDSLDEYRAPLLAELLHLLIVVVSHTPVVYTMDGYEREVMREVTHLLLGGCKKYNQILEKLQQTSLGGGNSSSDRSNVPVLNDAVIIKVIKALTTGSSSSGYDLNHNTIYSYFDPEYIHLTTKQQVNALETVRRHRYTSPATRDVHLPVVSRECICFLSDDSVDDFGTIRYMLYTDTMLVFLSKCIELATESASFTSSRLNILTLVIHLVTLQIHCQTSRYSLLELLHSDISIKSQGINRRFLDNLCHLYNNRASLIDDVIYTSGISYIISYFYNNSQEIQQYMQGNHSISFEAATAADTSNQQDTKKRRSEAAKLRMSNNVSNLASTFIVDDDDDDDDAVGAESNLTCILCHECNSDPIGYLSFIQPSNVISNYISGCDGATSVTTYRVVSINGCTIYSKPIDTRIDDVAVAASQIVGALRFNDHVMSDKRIGAWCHILAPIRGWVLMYLNATTIYLYDIKMLEFNTHGCTRLHISTCSHTVHYDCYQQHYAATLQDEYSNSNMTITASQASISVDVHRGELICPLCKSIVNALVPHTHRSTAESLLSPISTNDGMQTSVDTAQHAAIPSVTSITSCLKMSSNKIVPPGLLESGKNIIDRCISQFNFQWEHNNEADRMIGTILYNKNVLFSRSVHSYLSSTAYTFLSTYYSCHVGGSSISSNVLPLLQQLLLTARQLPEWYSSYSATSDGCEYRDMVALPLAQLLCGELLDATDSKEEGDCKLLDVNTITSSQCRHVLKSIPYTTTNCNKLYSSRRLSLILQTCIDRGSISASSVWNIYNKPILSQDIHVIAIACVTAGCDVACIHELLKILCYARLVQVMIEGVATSTATSAAVDTTSTAVNDGGMPDVCAYSYLFDNLARTVNEALYGVAQATQQQQCASVIDAWVPYLHFTHLVLQVLYSTTKGDSMCTSYCSNSSVEEVLQSLQIQPMAILLQDPQLHTFASKWVLQYVQRHTVDTSLSHTNSAISNANDDCSDVMMTSDNDGIVTSTTGNDDVDDDDDEEEEEAYVYYGETADNAESDGNNDGDEDDDDGNMVVDGDGDGVGGDDDAGNDGVSPPNFIHPEAIQHLLDNPTNNLTHAQRQMLSLLLNNSNSNATGTNTSVGNSQWNLIGIDPSYSHIDETFTGVFVITGERSNTPSISSIHSTTPLQSSVAGLSPIYSLHGEKLLSYQFNDTSHFGSRHSQRRVAECLIALPHSYSELYNRTKDGERRNNQLLTTMSNGTSIHIDNTALCLICGRVCYACNRRNTKALNASKNDPGECTLHARTCGAGTGVFFLLERCAVLLIRGSRCCFSPSIYVDNHGDVPTTLVSGHLRPLFLSSSAYNRLQDMYINHQISKEVTQIRNSEDKILRNYWY